MYYLGIFSGLRKATDNFSKDSWYLGRYLKPGLSGYEAQVLITRTLMCYLIGCLPNNPDLFHIPVCVVEHPEFSTSVHLLTFNISVLTTTPCDTQRYRSGESSNIWACRWQRLLSHRFREAKMLCHVGTEYEEFHRKMKSAGFKCYCTTYLLRCCV
jgi:hypothetical protein